MGSDNGGAISHGASNWPLRGTKGTLFEGGTRAETIVHAPHLTEKTGYVSNNLVHITDWMPTLLSAAGYSGSASSNLGRGPLSSRASTRSSLARCTTSRAGMIRTI